MNFINKICNISYLRVLLEALDHLECVVNLDQLALLVNVDLLVLWEDTE